MKQPEIIGRTAPWTDEAIAHLAQAAEYDTTGGLQTLEDVLRGALLVEIVQGRQVLMRYAAKPVEHSHGIELVIVAAAGRAKKLDLVAKGLEDVAARFPTVDADTVHTRRMGLVKKLAKHGFTVHGWILRRRRKCH